MVWSLVVGAVEMSTSSADLYHCCEDMYDCWACGLLTNLVLVVEWFVGLCAGWLDSPNVDCVDSYVSLLVDWSSGWLPDCLVACSHAKQYGCTMMQGAGSSVKEASEHLPNLQVHP